MDADIHRTFGERGTIIILGYDGKPLFEEAVARQRAADIERVADNLLGMRRNFHAAVPVHRCGLQAPHICCR